LNYIRTLELGAKAISGLRATPVPTPVPGGGFQRELRQLNSLTGPLPAVR